MLNRRATHFHNDERTKTEIPALGPHSSPSKLSDTMKWCVTEPLCPLIDGVCLRLAAAHFCFPLFWPAHEHTRRTLYAQVTAMKDVAELDQELTIEERNLLSVAYKNIIVSLAHAPLLSLGWTW